MKRLTTAIIALTFVAAISAEEKSTLKDSKDKVSYSIGLDIGSTLKKQNIDVNADALVTGLKDALTGAKPQLTEDQIKETMTTFSNELRNKQQAATQEAAQKMRPRVRNFSLKTKRSRA